MNDVLRRRPTLRHGARERLLAAAYELFSQHGVRAVGIDAVIERAGVARMSLYNHFPSKHDLVLAFLQRREERWTRQWLIREVELRARCPREQLLCMFDLLDEWFQQAEFEGCPFVRVLMENTAGEDALHAASAEYLQRIRDYIAAIADAANVIDPERFARQWQILMKGAIVSALEGDRSAARWAKEVAVLLLEQSAQRTQQRGHAPRRNPGG